MKYKTKVYSESMQEFIFVDATIVSQPDDSVEITLDTIEVEGENPISVDELDSEIVAELEHLVITKYFNGELADEQYITESDHSHEFNPEADGTDEEYPF